MNPVELLAFDPKDDDCTSACPENLLEHPIVFVERFWQWRESLYVVACRFAVDRKAATELVEGCFRKACANPPRFESNGEFGSWLLRILIKEALLARRTKKRTSQTPLDRDLRTASGQVAPLPLMDEFWCLENTS
jgi:DNA-directed RNA polymerase specialized sigma24 family protein